jgi:hypothetical protein
MTPDEIAICVEHLEAPAGEKPFQLARRKSADPIGRGKGPDGETVRAEQSVVPGDDVYPRDDVLDDSLTTLENPTAYQRAAVVVKGVGVR